MKPKYLPGLALVSALLAAVLAPVGQRAATIQLAIAGGTGIVSRGFGALIPMNGPYEGNAIAPAPSPSRDLLRPASSPQGRGLPRVTDSQDAESMRPVAQNRGAAMPAAQAGAEASRVLPEMMPALFQPVNLENGAPGFRQAAPWSHPTFDSRLAPFGERVASVASRVAGLSGAPTVTNYAGQHASTSYPVLVALAIAHLSSTVPSIAESETAWTQRSEAPASAGSSSARPASASRGAANAHEQIAKSTVTEREGKSAELVDLTKPVAIDWPAVVQAPAAASSYQQAPSEPLRAGLKGQQTTRAARQKLSDSSSSAAANHATAQRSAAAPKVMRAEWAENTPLPQALDAARAAQVVAADTQGQQPRSLESTIFTTPSYQQAAPIYTGKLISLDLVGADIRTFFRLIHRISGLNIVVDSDVTGTVTLSLDDVPWDQALDLVLKDNNLGKVFEGNVLRIARVSTLTAEAQSQAELQTAKVSSEPLITIFRRLKYAHVCDQMASTGTSGGSSSGGGGGGGSTMGSCGGGGASGSSGGAGGVPGVASILKRFKPGTVLSDRGSIVEDPRDNAIIITDVPSQIPVIESVINKLDTKSKQISIQVRVILATANFTRTLSTVLGTTAHNLSTTGSLGTGQGVIGTANTPSPLPPLAAVTQPQSVGSTGFGAFAITTSGARYVINAAIAAAEEHDQARTISRPTIVTQDNVLGEVQQGVQIPIQTDINNTIAVQYVNATLMLSVTPQVTVDNKVFLNIYVNNASIGSINTFVGPTINTQQATTQVLVPDGGTVVFGGITVTTRGRSANYIPLIGSIPVLGNLFKSSQVNDQNQELLFFVTPQVLQG